MLRKLMTTAVMLGLLTLLAAPLVWAQTGDPPVTRPDPNDPYRIFISDDQAVYCGTGILGDPITEFCIESGVVPLVLYDQDGTLLEYQG